MKTFTRTALAVVLLALAACGGDGDSAGDTGPPTSGIAAGPGISIDDALASDSDEQLLVNGTLLAQGDEVRLCSALAESFPPQCGGASLVVEGLKLEEVDGLVTEGDVSWTDRPIQLLGVVSDGTLTVSENAAA
ncbi:MAG TPA: hypothetical protein VLA87_02900 [Gaiellaceae bacterium]|nr:hypothetical protein [Gaiellaceae bacterium]